MPLEVVWFRELLLKLLLLLTSTTNMVLLLQLISRHDTHHFQHLSFVKRQKYSNVSDIMHSIKSKGKFHMSKHISI